VQLLIALVFLLSLFFSTTLVMIGDCNAESIAQR